MRHCKKYLDLEMEDMASAGVAQGVTDHTEHRRSFWQAP